MIPIKGFEDYLITENGEIYSIKEDFPRKISFSIDRYGYYKCCLCNGGKHSFRVHRLVASTFIPNPLNKPLVNHLNSNRLHNHVDNLEWATYQENNIHAVIYGNHNLNKHVVQFIQDAVVNIFHSAHDASVKTGIDYSAIAKCCRGERKTAGNFKWRWLDE